MNKLISNFRQIHFAQGFTLLEVMVAMIILAIGLLGLAGLQAISLTRNNESNFRQQAALLAYDIADRMRANIAGVRDPSLGNNSSYHMMGVNLPSSATVTCPCTPAQLAAKDLIEWSDLVSTELPSGNSIVCIDNTPDSLATPPTPAAPQCDAGSVSPVGTLYAVKIWWNEKDRNNTGGISQKLFTMSFRP